MPAPRFPIWTVRGKICACPDAENCRSPAKHPLTRNGVKDASDDPAVLDAWRAEHPGCNWGIATGSGLLVVDLDIKPGKNGLETLKKLGELPRTRIVRTGSGGLHIYFRVQQPLGNTAGRIGPGVDTRCEGGYVLAPGSKHVSGGEYSVAADEPIADAPAWLLALLAPAVAPEAAPAVRPSFGPATPDVLQAAVAALEAHGPAIQGDGGDAHTWQAMAILRHDFALTEAEALPIAEAWNATCKPPWGASDLLAKLRGGEKYGKAEYGCKRKPHALIRVKTMLEQWRNTGSDPVAAIQIIERASEMIARENLLPSERGFIEIELKAATGLNSRAVGLPPAVRKSYGLPGKSSNDVFDFDCSASGAPLMTMNNVVKVLEQQKAKLAFDTFLQRVVKEDGSEWTDPDTLEFTLQLQRAVGLNKIAAQAALEGVLVYARRKQRNAVEDFLRGLTWDGKPRIARFLSLTLGAVDSEYTRSASTNFWRSLVMRPLDPGCKVDNMIVLEGAQGILKSSALKTIVGTEWFAEASESPHSKDFFQGLQGKWLIEIAELDSFSRADVTAVKRVLSCQVDRLRLPYGKLTQDFPRQGIFAGTTNRNDWSRDDTGARRFWPVTCTTVDIEAIKRVREQCFAEAVVDVAAKKPWWEMPGEATAQQQEARRQADPWEDLLTDFFRTAEAKEFKIVELLGTPLGLDAARMDRAEQARVANILRRLGFTRHGNVWRP